jgi:uncharacterized protein with HEPN domain
MEHDPRCLLWDVREGADAILRFTASKSVEDYFADDMLRAAVERRFEIIGEALSRLTKVTPELAARIPDLNRAIALRNVLIHGYAVVDDLTVWETLHEDLPGLREKVVALLAELEQKPPRG